MMKHFSIELHGFGWLACSIAAAGYLIKDPLFALYVILGLLIAALLLVSVRRFMSAISSEVLSRNMIFSLTMILCWLIILYPTFYPYNSHTLGFLLSFMLLAAASSFFLIWTSECVAKLGSQGE